MGEDHLVLRNDALRHAREDAGWSREELAARLETNAFTIYRWEHGRARPSPYYRQRLITLFGQSSEALGLISPNTLPSTAAVFATALPPLPPLANGLIGRSEVMTTLRQRLITETTGTTLGLYGLPGAGKTAIVVELAHDAAIRTHFMDGILWAGLGPKPNVFAELRHWGAAIGLPAEHLAQIKTPTELSRAIQRAIGTRHILIVIDDAWQSEDALFFKVGGPGCTTIITTRFLPVAAQLAQTLVVRVPELSIDEGMLLISSLAPTAIEYHAEAIQHLVQAVGGLPLALTLIGHYLYAKSLGGQSRRFSKAIEYLQSAEARLKVSETRSPMETPPALLAGVPLSLQSTIAFSVDALSPTACQVLRALALFPPKPNTFTEEAAYAIAEVEDNAAFLSALDEIVDAGLLESSSDERYTMHQTIVDYAQQFPSSGAARQQFVTYYASYACRYEHEEMMLAREQINIQAAFTQMEMPQVSLAQIQGILAFARFLIARCTYPIAESLLHHSVNAARILGETHEEAWAWYALGQVALEQDAYDQGMAATQQSFALAQTDQDLILCIHLQHLFGTLSTRLGQYDRAEAYYQQGITISQANGMRLHHPHLRAMGLVHMKRGEMAQATACYQEGHALAQAEGDIKSVERFLQALGVIAAQRGELAQARAYFEDALRLARELDMPQDVCIMLANLAIAKDMGDSEQAMVYLREGIQIAHQYHFRERLCGLFAAAGEVALTLHQIQLAQDYLREGLVIAREINSPDKISLLLLNLGQLALVNEELIVARLYLHEGMDLTRKHHHAYLVRFLQEWGNLTYREGHFVEAKEHYQEAFEMAKAAEHSEAQAFAIFGLAQVAAAQQEISLARQYALQSLSILKRMQHKDSLMVLRWIENLGFPLYPQQEQG